MDEIGLIKLEITPITMHEKETLQDEKQFIVVYEYECSKSVDFLAIDDCGPQNSSDFGLDSERELVSATISFSFKSILKGDF